MSRFNPKVITEVEKTKTVNFALGEAYKETNEMELISILLTSFVQDQFYRGKNDVIAKVAELVKTVDPKFAAQAAIFARNEFGMRSITHVLAGELAHLPAAKGKEWTKRFYDKVVARPDDMTETMSYYVGTYGKPIPNALKKGFASALGRFDAYQLAKYRSEGKKVKLVDVINTVHPKSSTEIVSVDREELIKSLQASLLNTKEVLKKNILRTRIAVYKADENKEGKVSIPLFEALTRGLLKSTETWESKLSEAGKADSQEDVIEAKKDAWIDLVKNRKLGYFAALRNLRNIVEQAPKVLDDVLAFITNEKAIKNSKVLPFRFQTAMDELKEANVPTKVIRALSTALDISVSNMPKLPGKTLIAIDGSGSMRGTADKHAALFGAAIYKSQDDADIITFASGADYVKFNPTDSISTLSEQIMRKMSGGGTNFHAIFQTANKKYDRIFILSDMQGWIGGTAPTDTFNSYKRLYDSNPIVYSWDLQNYGTLQFPEKNVYLLAGWSDKIFNIMDTLEQDKKALINKIKAIEI